MSSPFKFLNAFNKEDKDYFFGRDEEINRAYDMVFKTRIGVILGKSGTGKTSLVQCGLANRFDATDWKDIYIRRKSNFNDSLLATLQRLYEEPQKTDYLDAIFAADFSFEPENDSKPTTPAAERKTNNPAPPTGVDINSPKSLVEHIYRKYHTPLYLIFDQFEEMFISGDKEGTEKRMFIENIKEIARLKVPCVLLFVMREEYLAHLHDFEKAIPTFFDHRLRVEQVTERKAISIVERLLKEAAGKKFPANPANERSSTPELLFDYESIVPELIVKSVSEGHFEVKLPFLQIYMSMLYLLGASKGEGKVVFTPELVEELGPMNKVLRSFVNDRIIEAEGMMENKKAALSLLKIMVTEQGTKKTVTAEELKFYASHNRIRDKDIYEFLHFFSEQHILRDLEGNYELTHDELAAVISVIRPWEQTDVPQIPGSPFKGLSPYESEDALLFFGRDSDIQAILTLLRSKNLVVVTGASGSGKSSVIKAGVLPRLREIGYDFYEILRPGNQPVHTLQVAIEKLKEKKSAGKGFVLLIDQFEELLTRGVDKVQVAEFYELLKNLAESPSELLPDVEGSKQIKVIITVRSDFEPHFEQSILQQYWKQGRFIIPLPGPKELIEIVERPAALSACRFEPEDLSNRIAGEVAGRVAALPLLSFALHLMYEKSLTNGRVIDEKIYDAVGGVIGSLRTHADEIYGRLLNDAHRRTMRHIMLRMVSMEGAEYASRRVPLSELSYPDTAENQRIHTIIELLCQERLIIQKTSEAKEGYVEPAHDALLWGWSTLWEWIRDFSKERILIRDRIAAAVTEWKREGKGSIGLWTEDKKLAELKDLLAEENVWLNQEEIAFAEACLKAHEFAVRKEAEKGKYLALIGYAISLICILLSSLAINKSIKASESAKKAEASSKEAETQKKQAIRAKITADSLAVVSTRALTDVLEAKKQSEKNLKIASKASIEAEKERNMVIYALDKLKLEKEYTEEQKLYALKNYQKADSLIKIVDTHNIELKKKSDSFEDLIASQKNRLKTNIKNSILHLEYESAYIQCLQMLELSKNELDNNELDIEVLNLSQELAYYYSFLGQDPKVRSILDYLKIDYKDKNDILAINKNNAIVLDKKYFPEMVRINSSLEASITEVTFFQYNLYAKVNNQRLPNTKWTQMGTHPAVGVSWYDAVQYSNWLTVLNIGNDTVYSFIKNREAIDPLIREAWDITPGGVISFLFDKPILRVNYKTGGYRLPLEEEWQMMGSDITDIDNHAWYAENSEKNTQPVGLKQANVFGLYDIFGNASEWSMREKGKYKERSLGGNTIEQSLLGGSWESPKNQVGTAYKVKKSPINTDETNGFRIVRTINNK